MNRAGLIIIVFSLFFNKYVVEGQAYLDSLYRVWYDLYDKGELLPAEKVMLTSLSKRGGLTEGEILTVYNNLAITYMALGRYETALDYFSRIQNFKISDSSDEMNLAAVYVNKATIYEFQRSYSLALEYLEKSTRIYNKYHVKENLAIAYLNMGVTYYKIKEYESALKNLEKSFLLMKETKSKRLYLVLLNLAKTFAAIGQSGLAERNFTMSAEHAISNFGNNYFRLVDVYFGYGEYLLRLNRIAESKEKFRKARDICHKTYGEKNTLTSRSFKFLGDACMAEGNADSALYYYQRSLISISADFNDLNIMCNPSADSSLFNIRLFENLKGKAMALELKAGGDDVAEKEKLLTAGMETIDRALTLIDDIRVSYNEESRLFLAENEKSTYFFAAGLCLRLYSLTKADSLLGKTYLITQKAKAAVLRNGIAGNNLIYSPAVPDSLREKHNSLSAEIASVSMLLGEKKINDTEAIASLKDEIFALHREVERVNLQIASAIPQYSELIRKTDPVRPGKIMRGLSNDETIVDYFLSNTPENGMRKLYTFVLSRDKIVCLESDIDSLFGKYAAILKNTSDPSNSYKEDLSAYISALNYMYKTLVQPCESLFNGRKLIIIPDDELEWLPFEAFIKSLPQEGENGFDGLDYLINHYSFSYDYASSLLYHPDRKSVWRSRVFSFSPSYENSGISSLAGAREEIERINNSFRGKSFTGDAATREKFLEVMQDRGILHLAMHSMTDSINSKYSYLQFSQVSRAKEEGRLYNYEVSLGRINSPMVVLSACNSGSGTLYSGEGLMSLARSFVLAGASSVVKTSWEVNDESSSVIISDFYNYLSKGKRKDEALRLAKINYLKTAGPAFAHPYYWAAYNVLGDTRPIREGRKFLMYAIIFLLIVIAGYLMRRRILRAGSE